MKSGWRVRVETGKLFISHVWVQRVHSYARNQCRFTIMDTSAHVYASKRSAKYAADALGGEVIGVE
jgi:hypothetical protein